MLVTLSWLYNKYAWPRDARIMPCSNKVRTLVDKVLQRKLDVLDTKQAVRTLRHVVLDKLNIVFWTNKLGHFSH